MDSKRTEGRRRGGTGRKPVDAGRVHGGGREPVEGWTPVGLGLGAVGIATTVLGLWLVARGDITAAPLLLVLAYLVIFPLALTR
jgi:hypothetical protein